MRLLLIFAMATALHGQAVFDGIDASRSVVSSPFSAGATDPANCVASTRPFFYNTASNTLKVCNTNNVWTAFSAGSATLPFTMSGTTTTSLTVGSDCTTTPCIVEKDHVLYPITTAGVGLISAGTGAVFIEQDGATMRFGHNGITFTSCTGCTASTGVTGFTAGRTPLYECAVNSGVWTSCSPRRVNTAAQQSFASTTTVQVNSNSFDVIQTAVPYKYTGAGAPTGAVTNSRRGDIRVNTTTGDGELCNNPTSDCSGENVSNWVPFGHGAPRDPEIEVFPAGTAVATGDGKVYYRIPARLNGMVLSEVAANVYTAGTTGTTDIQLARCAVTTSGNICSGTVADMLSTKLTIDSGENDSASAATAAVINASNDDVTTGQIIRVDIDAVSTTPPQGLLLMLTFRLP